MYLCIDKGILLRILCGVFPKLLDDLKASGLSDKAIADAVQSTQPTINRLRNGDVGEPMYSLGQRIVELHRERCPQAGDPAELVTAERCN